MWLKLKSDSSVKVINEEWVKSNVINEKWLKWKVMNEKLRIERMTRLINTVLESNACYQLVV